MARPDEQSITHRGPWDGMNDAVSDRMVPLGQFTDCLNTVVKAGQITPRPGYVKVKENSFSFIPQKFVDIATSFSVNETIQFCSSNNKFYYIRNNELRRMDPDSTNDVLVFADTMTTFYIDEVNDEIYFWELSATADLRNYDSLDSGGSIGAVLVTETSVPNSLAIHDDGANIYAYWTKDAVGVDDKVYRADVTVGTIQEVCDTGTGEGNSDVVVDPSGGGGSGILYFSSLILGKVYSCPVGVSQTATEILDRNIFKAVRRISIDAANNGIYYIDDDDDAIYRCTLTGTNNHVAFHLPSDSQAADIFVDTVGNRVFVSMSGQTTVYRAFTDAANIKILSQFPFERSVSGVAGGTFSKDIVFLQLLNEDTSEVFFAFWFPATDVSLILPMGWTDEASPFPNIFCTDDLNEDPATILDSFQSGYGRANWAWQGLGLDTARGGVLMANGEGGHVMNYVLSDTIMKVTWTTAGLITLTVNGETSGTFDDTYTAAQIKNEIQDNMVTVDNVIVTLGGSPPGIGTTAEIRFCGSKSGQTLPLATVTDEGGDATIELIQAGGADAGAILYLRPTGLPAPVIDSINVGASTGKNLNGVYSWKLSYFSATLGIQSPASVESEFGDAAADGRQAEVFWTNPSTLYFDTADVLGGPVIDMVRIFRKRHGNTGTSPPVGGDVDDSWYWVADVLASAETYLDNIPSSSQTTERAPAYGYPPSNAAYVEVHKDRSFWMDLTQGLQRIHDSELRDPVSGLLGMEYVGAINNAVLDNNTPSDHHATALKSDGRFLLAFTNKDAFVINTDLLEFGGYQIRRLAEAGGCAGQHCIISTKASPELRGSIIYPDDQGNIYEFSGTEARPISTSIREFIKTLVKQTWVKTSYLEPGLDTWYYASAILDSENNRIIISTFLDEGAAENSPVQLVFDMDTRSWSRWDIPAWSFFVLREWSGSTGKGRPVVMFSDANANLLKLQDGKGDDGSSFAWHFITGKLDLGDPIDTKLVRDCHWVFDLVDFGGTDAAVTLLATEDNKASGLTVGPYTLDQLLGHFIAGKLDIRCQHIQYKISGTCIDDQTRPRLVAHKTVFEPNVGPR